MNIKSGNQETYGSPETPSFNQRTFNEIFEIKNKNIYKVYL